jgi:hypothetical protein
LNKPEVDTEPHVVDHADAVLTVNCLEAFSLTVAAVGEIVVAKTGNAGETRQKKTDRARRN